MSYDITNFSSSQKAEIAMYIKESNLKIVNRNNFQVEPPSTFYVNYGKRIIDFFCALIALIITAPINIIIAIVTLFDVGRPLFFKQMRIGKDEKTFIIIKFRNMTNECDANGELLPPQQRVTKWGRFVRKTSLDELLNFVSILKGDMSIIGPRPLLDSYEERMHNRHKSIYKVRPGLECPTLAKMDHMLNWQERFDNYVWYVENVSLITDIKLVFKIVKMTFDKKLTKKRELADNGGFLGYDINGNVIYTKAVPEVFVEKFLKNHGYANIDEAIKGRTNCD